MAAVALLVALLIGMSFTPTVEASIRTWPGHAAAVGLALTIGLLTARSTRVTSPGRTLRRPSRSQSLTALAAVSAASALASVLRPGPAAAWCRLVMRGADPASQGQHLPHACLPTAGGSAARGNRGVDRHRPHLPGRCTPHPPKNLKVRPRAATTPMRARLGGADSFC